MDGRQLYRRLAAERPGCLPVLYMSGYAGRVIPDEELQTAENFIQKPFTPVLLTRKIEAALNSSFGSALSDA
jgi:FixJ family two-component response regulator